MGAYGRTVQRETAASAEAPRRPAAGIPPAPRVSHPVPAPPTARPARGRPQWLNRAWWNTPRLVRALTAAALIAALLFGAVTATVLAGARSGIDAIGHQAAPQAVRSADLYFALNDMDAQAANLLLLGADPDYSALRRQTLDVYEQRRAEADTDLQRAAETTADDPAGQKAVHAVIDQLGHYEALVARAQLLEEQAHAPAGKPSPEALNTYRQATDLLRQQLLPAAGEVIAANDAAVAGVYTDERGGLAAGRWWMLATGGLALAALAVLQRTLAVRFRRLVNVPLAAATLVVAAALVDGLVLASRADDHLVVAKSNSYDSVIALSRARATAFDMNADESRYLTDPTRAAAYEQSFLDKTQAVLRLDGATLASYDGRLRTAVDAHHADRAAVPFEGFLGTELRNITFPGEQEAAEKVLTAFQQYQLDDRKTRAMIAQGRLKEAVTYNTGLAAGQSNADFNVLSDALDDVLAINRQAMDRAVADADDDLDALSAAAGGLALAAVLAATAAGVRPRLREYR